MASSGPQRRSVREGRTSSRAVAPSPLGRLPVNAAAPQGIEAADTPSPSSNPERSGFLGMTLGFVSKVSGPKAQEALRSSVKQQSAMLKVTEIPLTKEDPVAAGGIKIHSQKKVRQTIVDAPRCSACALLHFKCITAGSVVMLTFMHAEPTSYGQEQQPAGGSENQTAEQVCISYRSLN